MVSFTKHNLTISEDTSKFKYYLGGSCTKQQGTVSKSDMSKYTVHGNLSLICSFHEFDVSF